MPNWHEIGEELKRAGSSFDVIRRGYIHSLSSYTGRNTIKYTTLAGYKKGILMVLLLMMLTKMV